MKTTTLLSFISITSLVLFSGHIMAQDGSIDPSFDPGTGANSHVLTTNIQTDGKILIGGNFSAYDGTPRGHVARLNSNGSLDASFDPGLGLSNSPSNINIQGDGKIIFSGEFNAYDGTPRNRIVRVNQDGSIDTSFDPGSGTNGTIFYSILQSDGKILVGGSFTMYDGTLRRRIARINQDGSLDTSFDPGGGVEGLGLVQSIAIQDDGKILIVGPITMFNGVPVNNIVRLNTDGSLDPTFDTSTGADENVLRVIPLDDGKMIIAGLFTSYDGVSRNHIARLHPDGSLDTTFDPGTGANDYISRIVKQNDGKLIVVGNFTQYDGTPSNRLTRLHPDGSLDSSFDIGTGPNLSVIAVKIQNDGKLIIGGVFTSFNGTQINRIVRLNNETLSIDNFLASQVKIYPNPVKDLLTISDIPDGSTINIVAMSGKLIDSYTNVQGTLSINTKHIVSGIYIVKIENNGHFTHKKLIVN